MFQVIFHHKMQASHFDHFTISFIELNGNNNRSKQTKKSLASEDGEVSNSQTPRTKMNNHVENVMNMEAMKYIYHYVVYQTVSWILNIECNVRTHDVRSVSVCVSVWVV